VNRQEVTALLAVIQSYDHRKPGEADIIAWHGVLGDLLFDECRDAVLRHFRESTDWLMPAHVRRFVMAHRDKTRPAIEWGDDSLVSKPEWFDERMRQAREATRADNEARRERGEPVFYGETVLREVDRRPHRVTFREGP
jgi:hypothetical protein